MLVQYRQIRGKEPLIINDVKRYASRRHIGGGRNWESRLTAALMERLGAGGAGGAGAAR
jgi:hypothetical protein